MGERTETITLSPASASASQSPLRVLYLMEGLVLGGAERRFVRLARLLDRDRIHLVIGVLRPGGVLEEEVRSLGIEIVPFTRHSRFDLSPIWHLSRYVRQERIDVVHSMHWLSNFMTMLAAWQIPHLAVVGSTVSRVYDEALRGRYRLALDHLFWRRMDSMVVNTPTLRDYLLQRRFPEERLTIIANGVDVPDAALLSPVTRAKARALLGVPPDVPLIGTVARLEPIKNLETLLQAARVICERLPDAHVAVVGDGSERARLEALAASLGIDEKVHFTGTVAHSDLVLPAFDAFVLCSRSEGMPNALLEAGAWGLPLIATPVGGAVEIVLEGQTGLLTPVGDAQALAERLCALLDQPDRAASMGRAAREHVANHFSSGAMVQRYESVYRLAAEARSRKGAARR